MKILEVFWFIIGITYSVAVYSQIDTPAVASGIFGLPFTQDELDSLRQGVRDLGDNYQEMRAIDIDNGTPPALYFNPLPWGFVPNKKQEKIDWQIPTDIKRPATDADLSFMSISQLASLLKSRQITSLELTKHFLSRLKRHAPTLQCAVTITEELALRQAERADAEIAAGKYRGLLHGIPYGAKDLLAVPGYPTTWGAEAYKDQTRNETATVVKKLEAAGAILVAKLTLGALAMGDVWFGGITKNPWNLEQGSSGSSAGSASATVAGLVPFAIGTETRGSIVSPSTRCGATGLRPTFGTISRAGAMALSWSMDKIGPICRNAKDCAIVFDAIRGVDQKDYTVIEAAFNYKPDKPIHQLKVAYFEDLFEQNRFNYEHDNQTLNTLRSMGIDLIPITWHIDLPVSAIGFILTTESATAFDQLTRSGADDLLVRQMKRAWPNIFRQARFVTAVEYLQANRIRTLLINQLHQLLKEFDVIITPTFGGDQLLATNLTGQPVIVVPNGFRNDGTPTSITFLGNLFEEEKIIRLAEAYQEATDFEDKHPTKFKS